MIWKCTIPDYDLISPNRFMRMHFRTRMAEHKKLLELMMIYGDEVNPFHDPVDITIHREYGFRKRAMDPDNLYGAVKLPLDVIREPGPRSKKKCLCLIADDSNAHIKNLSVTQAKSADKITRVHITVECPP